MGQYYKVVFLRRGLHSRRGAAAGSSGSDSDSDSDSETPPVRTGDLVVVGLLHPQAVGQMTKMIEHGYLGNAVTMLVERVLRDFGTVKVAGQGPPPGAAAATTASGAAGTRQQSADGLRLVWAGDIRG